MPTERRDTRKATRLVFDGVKGRVKVHATGEGQTLLKLFDGAKVEFDGTTLRVVGGRVLGTVTVTSGADFETRGGNIVHTLTGRIGSMRQIGGRSVLKM